GDKNVEGWRVPLWLRRAAPADVYPKPQIHLVITGPDPEHPVRLAIDDPEKLCFWTSTQENDGANTNAWAAIDGIDFSVIDTNALTPPVNAGFDNGTLDEVPKAPDPSIVPALGRFTFTVAPSARAVNVVAERARQAVGVALQNVTVMRARVVKAIGEDRT